MSKKSKRKKLKKKLRKMLRAQMAQSEQSKEAIEAPIKKIEKTIPQEKKEIKKEKSQDLKPPAPEIKKISLTEKLNPYFTYDIKRVLITIGISVLVIFGIVLISNYTNWLNTLSQKMSTIINL